MKLIVLGLFALLFAQAAASQPLMTKEEYGIYSVVLRDFVRDIRRWNNEDSRVRFLILSQAGSDTQSLGKRSGRSVDRSFDNRNKRKANIEPEFTVNFDYTVADEPEILGLIEKESLKFQAEQERRRMEGKPMIGSVCGPGWGEAFFQKFPATRAYIRLSRIGFSRDHRTAYVEVHATGQEWTENISYLLKWTADGWKVVTAGGGFGIC